MVPQQRCLNSPLSQNPLLASAYGAGSTASPLLAADKLRHKFSPLLSPTAASASIGTSGGSAFDSVASKGPPASPPNRSASPKRSPASPSSPTSTTASASKPSELMSIEKIVNGLDKSKQATAAAVMGD